MTVMIIIVVTVACCCLIIIFFITHLFFVYQFIIHSFVKHLLFISLLMPCSNIWFFLLHLIFVYLVVYCSLNVPCLFVIYSFAAYLIILLLHLFVTHCCNRILLSLTNSLLLFSCTVGLSKPLLSDSFNDDFVTETSLKGRCKNCE